MNIELSGVVRRSTIESIWEVAGRREFCFETALRLVLFLPLSFLTALDI